MPDWLRNLRLRPRRMGARLGSEIDRELSIHVQMQIEENIEAGMSVEMAREKAFQTFGILSRVRQEARDVRQSRMEKSMDNFWQDLRFSVRLLIKRPLFTLAVVFILAIGFGASLTFFSLLNNVVLNPLPEVEDAAALVNVKFSASSFPNFEDVRDATQTLDGLSAFADYGMALGETDGPARLILGLVVSDHYFEVLGVEPTAGRLIGAEVG